MLQSVFHHMDEHGGGSKGRCAFSEFSRNRFQSNRCAISTGPSSPVIISSGSNDSESEENNVSPDLDMDVAELTWKLKAGGKAAVKREKPVVPTKTNKTLGDATATSPFKETCNKTCVEKEKDSTRKDIYENRFQSNRCTISTGPSSPVIISSGSSDSESEENSVLPDLDVDVAELTWKLKADGKASVKREKPVVPAKTNKTLGDATATSPFKETSNKTCVEKEKDSTCKDTYENRIQSNRCTISTGPSSPVIISSGSSDSESEENSVLPDLDVDVAELTWKLKADGKASVKREKPVVPAKTNKTLEGATVASLFEKTSNKTVVEKKYSTREDIQAGDGTFVASGYKYDGMQCRLKRVKFLQGFSTFPAASDRLYVKLTERQTACLMDLLHDVSDSNSTYCMDMLLDFCCRGKPPVSVMDKLVNCAFCNLLERALNIRVYNVILKLWQLHPDLIRLDPQLVIAAGDVLQNHLKQCDPSHDTCSTPTVTQRDCSDPDSPTALQAQLYFKLFTKGLQLDLSQRKLADWGNVTKSQAYCCLSPDSSKKLMNKLIQWLEFCLTVRHLQHAQHCRWWISELQSLLGVCVLVSRDRQSTAKMLASALKQIYAVMPDLSAKKQLLQNFSCPLLCFFLVSLVMGEQCKHTIISSEFPSSICEFTDKYYSALPPEHQMTSSCDISPEHAFAHRHIKYRHSVQSCEELAMLVFFISKSYLACRQSMFLSILVGLSSETMKYKTALVNEKAVLVLTFRAFTVLSTSYFPSSLFLLWVSLPCLFPSFCTGWLGIKHK